MGLREISRVGSNPRHTDEIGWRGDGDWPHLQRSIPQRSAFVGEQPGAGYREDRPRFDPAKTGDAHTGPYPLSSPRRWSRFYDSRADGVDAYRPVVSQRDEG